MTTPRAVPCRFLRMRPLALAAAAQKPQSAAVCENQTAGHRGAVLREEYDAGQWTALDTCRSCPSYQALRP